MASARSANEPMAADNPMTSEEIRACVQMHFGGGEKHAVLFEVRNGTAWRANRSTDAVVMSLWPSLGLELWGMEIKASRADWLRERRDPAKASGMFEFFDRWFLVAPAHVVRDQQAEIPAPWGWLQPSNGRLVEARNAQKNKEPRAVDRHFLAAIMRRTAKTDDAFVEAAIARALKDQRAEHQREIEREVLRKLGESRREMESWIKLRDMLKQKPDGWVYQEDVIAALKMLMKSGVGSTISSLRSLKREVDRVQMDLEKIADDLGVEPDERRKSA